MIKAEKRKIQSKEKSAIGSSDKISANAALLSDPRLNAYRADLADKKLRNHVTARRFTGGKSAYIAVPVANLYQTCPDNATNSAVIPNEAKLRLAGAETQLLFGARVRVFERRNGYAWLQAEADSYVGYVDEQCVAASKNISDHAATHRLYVPRSFLYSEPDLRAAPTRALSMGSLLTVIGTEQKRGTEYALLPTGEAVIAKHLQKTDCFAKDYVSVAETLLHTPYLWGGSSAFGIDCSGLVQLAMAMAGKQVLRDSDMQAASIGRELQIAAGKDMLRRGDLIFWRGHVAIVCDNEHILHANGASMSVSREVLKTAIARIAPLYGQPTLFRRP